MEEPGLLEICTPDARARGIADGDRVRVFNHRGDILLKGASGRESSAGSGLCQPELGEDDPGFSEH
jgi:formylmethanofuran dehydrogenase subunit D